LPDDLPAVHGGYYNHASRNGNTITTVESKNSPAYSAEIAAQHHFSSGKMTGDRVINRPTRAPVWVGQNVLVQRRGAALSRRVPCNAGLGLANNDGAYFQLSLLQNYFSRKRRINRQKNASYVILSM